MTHRLVALDHVQLAMPTGQEPVAEAFYGGLLGMEVEPKPPVLAARGGRWFRGGGVALHLGADAEFHKATKAHPALLVEGLDDLVGVLEGAGVACRWDGDIPEIRRCMVEDPWGNRIELIDVAGPSPA